jgi:hypothetical protein
MTVSPSALEYRDRHGPDQASPNYIVGDNASELAFLKSTLGSVGVDEVQGRKVNEAELAGVLKHWSKKETDAV